MPRALGTSYAAGLRPASMQLRLPSPAPISAPVAPCLLHFWLLSLRTKHHSMPLRASVRAANAQIPCVGGHPRNIVFLCCDLFGVLPAVSRLSREQALYYYIRWGRCLRHKCLLVAPTEVSGLSSAALRYTACPCSDCSIVPCTCEAT